MLIGPAALVMALRTGCQRLPAYVLQPRVNKPTGPNTILHLSELETGGVRLLGHQITKVDCSGSFASLYIIIYISMRVTVDLRSLCHDPLGGRGCESELAAVARNPGERRCGKLG